MSAGGLDLRARLKSRDEIGKLAASFNAMLDDLQEAEANRDQYIEALASKEEALAMLLQRAIDSQEEERKRIARELHDETSHSLSAMLIAVSYTHLLYAKVRSPLCTSGDGRLLPALPVADQHNLPVAYICRMILLEIPAKRRLW